MLKALYDYGIRNHPDDSAWLSEKEHPCVYLPVR